ncbi:MAG: hypothetical protein IJX87_01155 [Clostridia bacterium]|nr:hypothetical protein [Clostridia bacterium]
MKLYFLSARPCALTLNGAYFGVTDTFERFAEISLKDNVYVQFIPEGRHPIGFFLTENIRFQPPVGCEVYLLKDGIALFARDFPPTDLSLKVITQQRFDDNLITVFQQGDIQLSLETQKGLFISTLPPAFSVCKVSFHNNFILLEGDGDAKKVLTVYALNGKCLLQEQILCYSYEENALNATLPLSDSLGRVADCSWELSQEACKQTKFLLRQPLSHTDCDNTQTILDELIPFAFFESVLIGANFNDMLSDELQPDSDKIKAFLGDFCAVTITDNPSVCGLVKKLADRLYEVTYYTVTTKEGKITDVTTAI